MQDRRAYAGGPEIACHSALPIRAPIRERHHVSKRRAARPAPKASPPARRPPRFWVAAASAATLVIAALIFVAAIALSAFAPPAPTAPAGSLFSGPVAQATRASWTDVSADQLAAMLEQHDFTLLNVKTPYIGEIAGTDLYIPYDQLAGRTSELPIDKNAKIVVYCRSGAESAMAVQTLLGLGYTNVYNLDGGMNAWVASGRQLVTKDRTGS